VFGITPRPSALTEGLGAPPKFTEVSFKPWCAARQTMAAVQAVRELLDGGIAAADITAIEVAVPPPFLKMVDHGIVGGRVSRLTSQPYQVALAALAPDLAFDVAQSREVPTDVLRFMNKVTVRADDNLLENFPQQWNARVEVRTLQGERERLIAHLPGDPARPFDARKLSAKSQRLIGPVAEQIADHCEAMLDGNKTPAQLLDLIDQCCARMRNS
jgi:2-methylcitrate dehydratase PrpD